MIWLYIILSSPFLSAVAHEAHHHGNIQEMKAVSTLPGTSIFHLDSEWKNMNGKSVKLSEFSGTPHLVAMLFTKCETACPIIVDDVKEIIGGLSPEQQKKIRVALFSLDSTRDTPEALVTFFEKRKLPSDWKIFTSKPSAVAELAAVLGIRYKRLGNGDFIHSNVVYLIDKDGTIKAQREGLKVSNKTFIAEIKKEIK